MFRFENNLQLMHLASANAQVFDAIGSLYTPDTMWQHCLTLSNTLTVIDLYLSLGTFSAEVLAPKGRLPVNIRNPNKQTVQVGFTARHEGKQMLFYHENTPM